MLYTYGTVHFIGDAKEIAKMKNELEKRPKELLGGFYDEGIDLFNPDLVESSRGYETNQCIAFDIDNKKIHLCFLHNLSNYPGDMILKNLIKQFPLITFVFNEYLEGIGEDEPAGLIFKAFERGQEVACYSRGFGKNDPDNEESSFQRAINQRDKESEKLFKEWYEYWETNKKGENNDNQNK